jgi:hypothetical protein
MWKKEEDADLGRPPVSSAPVTMATYTDAMSAFTKNATAFIEQIPLFTKARDSYEQAMRVSAELRGVLDAGDESLRSLMAQMEQAINNRVEKSTAFDKKKPELVKADITKPDKSDGRAPAVNELSYPKWSDLP